MPETDTPLLTMADIAREAGVSKITVSRALSGSSAVRRETRERIVALAQARGYKFNAAARNLRLQRTDAIAVIIEMEPTAYRSMSDNYPLALLGGIIEELATAKFSAVLSTAENFPKLTPAVDGVILLGQGLHNQAVNTVEQRNLPLVIWGSTRMDVNHTIVGSDNIAGGRLAAERLLSLGRRRAVFLGDTEHDEIADRLDGFEQAFAAAGGKLLARQACDFTFGGGHDAMAALLKRHGEMIDGVFACSDTIATGAIRALSEARRHIPEDVSVIGFDDSAHAAMFVPPLTTIRQNWHEAGRLLARKALAQVDGRRAKSEHLPVSLIIRDS